ncbi:hypothetical protein INR49_017872 [Caranx melampygus]|nr:hypothetical protein INR49_017872 [Caranx melampygus]
MNGVRSGESRASAGDLLHAPGCGIPFTRQWRLEAHETVHTGARPCRCTVAGCGRSFSRRSHLNRHMLQHKGLLKYKCKVATCNRRFYDSIKLSRHMHYCHGPQDKVFKCKNRNCSLTFKKRRQFKMHLMSHGGGAQFKCSKAGCKDKFHSHSQRKAHEKKHEGYTCPSTDCQVLEHTWGKLQKHRAKHPATIACQVCKKEFKKADALRRHKRIHASHKPVLVCPRDDCQAYFSTTFNLQHHIRKESMNRHLLHHDPNATALKNRQRPKKSWQKRLNGHHLPMVEDNLNNLFSLRMRISRRAKVETNLTGLFNERKIPHYVDPEVNLRNLFSIKQVRPPQDKPDVAPVKILSVYAAGGRPACQQQLLLLLLERKEMRKELLIVAALQQLLSSIIDPFSPALASHWSGAQSVSEPVTLSLDAVFTAHFFFALPKGHPPLGSAASGSSASPPPPSPPPPLLHPLLRSHTLTNDS